MFFSVLNVFLSVITFTTISKTCLCELPPPQASLYLYSPKEVEYTEVVVRRVGDNLTLVCELRGDTSKRDYVWNFMPGMPGHNSTGSPQPLVARPPAEAPGRSALALLNLTTADTGRYMCSSPPFSITKFILVQTFAPKHCARGAFSCGQRCVLPAYVCDGRSDCEDREDEDPSLCRQPCDGPDKLNCSSGRCIPAAACCGAAALCRQPACCDEHRPYSRLQASFEDFPLPPEDRHAPDDYGFIQSTIYTVTACALIFMIAVVLLVSAICKMHMKRAALRSYAAAERATRRHYSAQYAQTHRFPPCYEASRLLDQDGRVATTQSPHDSPSRLAMQCAVEAPNSPEAGFGLGRLSEIFSSRYRQVPTQCCEVEMQNVRSTSLNNSPTRSQNLDFRSPTYCDLNSAEFYFTNPEAGECGRDLNSMSTPVEFFRRRAWRRNTLERVMDSLGDRPSPFTLQLGRFQFSLPKLGRRTPTERRPDTPNVAEIDIEDLDFVRLNSNDTYTLNGRTIRLLGANFENYPVLSDGSIRPPPYTEAMRYKLYGPPPEYLSRDGLNGNPNNNVDEEARNNVEMPPNYEELGDGSVAGSSGCGPSVAGSGPSAAGNGPSAAGSGPSTAGNGVNVIATEGPSVSGTGISNVGVISSIITPTGNSNLSSVNNNGVTNTCSNDNTSISNNNCSDMSVPSTSNGYNANNVNNVNNNVVESIKAVIDNLPAIDSDVNANEAEA